MKKTKKNEAPATKEIPPAGGTWTAWKGVGGSASCGTAQVALRRSAYPSTVMEKPNADGFAEIYALLDEGTLDSRIGNSSLKSVERVDEKDLPSHPHFSSARMSLLTMPPKHWGADPGFRERVD